MSERERPYPWMRVKTGEVFVSIPCPGSDWILTVSDARTFAEQILEACRAAERLTAPSRPGVG